MTAKIEEFPAINSNPIFSVAKDGVILYSNKAGELLLNEWSVRVGEKLPLHLKIFVQRAISRKSIEKIEVNMGKKVFFVVFHPLPEKECVNIYVFDISDQKLEGKSRGKEIQEKANLELADIIDTKAVQSLMSDFYTLAHIPMALLDLKGNILVSVGWQEVCIKFHRVNPEACKHCIESDINLTTGVAPGGYKLYKCKNNMWDVVTPITVEGQHVGNIFSGQFFFDEEPLNYELFRVQAKKYGFNEEEYIKALEKVPRLSRKAVDTSMAFLMTFANMISQLSYSNIKLSQSLAERDTIVAALQESEERFRSVLENSLDSAYRLDLQNSCFDYMSPVIEQITGFLVKEIDAMGIDEYRARIHPNDRSIVTEGIAKSLDEGLGAHEYRFKCKDGKYRWLADHFSIIKDNSGMTRFRAGIARDITERKRAEEALRLSNIYNRSLIEANLDPLVTIGRDGKITDVNGATEQITGYSRDDLIGTDFSDYFTEPEKALTGYQQVFMHGQIRDYQLEIQHKDGHTTPVLYNASVYRDENGEVIGVFAAARDITAIKKAEEKIHILANAVESSDDAILTKSLDGSITSWNKGAEKVYGYLAEEVIGKNISVLEPDSTQGEIKHLIEKIKQGERIHHYETLRMKKDGTIINISITLSPVFNTSGKLVAISTIARDITENKKAEEAIRFSNLYNRSLIEASLDPLVTIGPDGKITDVNGATEQVTGHSRNDLIGTDFSDYFTEPEKARAGYQQAFTNGEVRDYPLEIQHKDGQITPVLYNASVYRDENGKVIGVFAAARDITERKKAEEAVKKVHDNLEKLVEERTAELEQAYLSLKESEKGLAEAQEMAHIGNWEWDIEANKAYWSEEMYRIFRRDPQESAPLYNEYLSYIHPDDRDYVDSAFKKASKGKLQSIECRITLDNGEEQVVHMQSEAFFDEKNTITRMKGIVQDVTERKRAEENLQKLASIVESSHDAILTLSLDGIITSWNKGAEQIYGYSVEEILGKNASILAPHNLKNEIKKLIYRVREGIKVKNYETMRLKKDGTLINISLTFSPIFNSLGKLTAISVIARDITERIKAEKSLAKAEDARKKEIHHRIKNNLQVISSLLDLQADKFNDSKVVEAFRESQNRVISMALIHEELYKEEGIDSLNFSEYLTKLVDTLLQTYKVSSKNIYLKMNLEEKIFLNMDTAIPLGIIVNELVSNSLKHAFRGRDKGEIQIEFNREKSKEFESEEHESTDFTLKISDDGVGIPETLVFEELDSLGFQLVTSLIEQLDGELEVKRHNGTEFTIRFTVIE